MSGGSPCRWGGEDLVVGKGTGRVLGPEFKTSSAGREPRLPWGGEEVTPGRRRSGREVWTWGEIAQEFINYGRSYGPVN